MRETRKPPAAGSRPNTGAARHRTAIADRAGPVTHAVSRVSRASRTVAGGKLRPLGLFAGQELLLMQLWERDGCTQVDLVDRLGLDPSTVTKMLKRLEREGLLVRAASPEDGRAMIVRLTPAGRQLQRAVEQAWGELESRATSLLSEREATSLLRLLAKVERGLTAS